MKSSKFGCFVHHPNLDDSEHALSHPKVDVLHNPNMDDSDWCFYVIQKWMFLTIQFWIDIYHCSCCTCKGGVDICDFSNYRELSLLQEHVQS